MINSRIPIPNQPSLLQTKFTYEQRVFFCYSYLYTLFIFLYNPTLRQNTNFSASFFNLQP